MTRTSETFLSPEDLVRHAGFLKRVASRLVGDDHDADELVQETFLAGLRRPPGQPDGLRAWLRRVCVNSLLARHRAEDRRRLHEANAARPEGSPSAEHVTRHRAAVRAVARAVTSLDEPYYTVILLRYYEGLPPREIATRLGIPVGTVKRRLERGRARLRTQLGAWNPDWRQAVLPLVMLPKPGVVAAAGAGAAAHGARDVLLGGIVMAKTVAGVIGVALLCGLAWLMMTGDGGEVVIDTGKAAPVPVAPGLSKGPAGPAAAIATQPFIGESEGGLFDLASADRDLDLFGVVTDPSGAPVAGAEVRTLLFPDKRLSLLGASGRDAGVPRGRTRTDRNGGFILRHQRGEAVDLVVRAEGFARKTVTCCQAGGRVDVQLSRAGKLQIVVRDQRNQPVPGARVRFSRSISSVEFYRTFDTRVGLSDARGRFSISDVEPGPARVRVVREGYVAADSTIEVEAGPDSETVIALQDGSVLTGRVTDRQTGAALAGAVITTSWSGEQSCRSDAGGVYQLRGWHGIRARLVHAKAAGYGQRSALVKSGSRLDFELDRGDVVQGRVESWDGRPVEDAQVTAIGSQWGADSRQQVDSRSGSTAADGSFALDGIRRDMPHSLIVQAAGHGRHMLDFDPHPDAPGVLDLGVVTLARAHTVEGVVLGPDGTPLEGAFVRLNGFNQDRLRRREAAAIGPSESYGREEGRLTDDLGRFRFPDLSPGPYKLMANRPRLPEISTQVILREGENPKTVVLRWTAGSRFVVKVREAQGGPIPEVPVWLGWEGLDTSIQGRTDAQGSAVFDGVPAGVELRLHPVIDVRRYVSPKASELRTQLGSEPFVIALTPARIVSGVVLDASDNPIPGVALAAYREGERITSANTDSRGRFRLRFDSPGHVDVRTWHYVAAGPAPAPRKRYQGALTGVPVPSEDLVLRASPVDEDRALSVTVSTPDGQAAAENEVRIVGPGVDRTVVTDASGSVHIDGLSGLTLSFIALAPEGSGFANSARTRVVPNGQSLALVLRAGILITGTVLDPDGNPAPGARVEATETGRQGGVVGVADEAGRFALRVPAGKTYSVAASLKDRFGHYQRATLEDVTGGDVVLRFP